MTSRPQRTELTIKEKLEIIESLNNKKCSRKDLQERYKITKPTLTRIMSRESELKNSKNSKLRRIRSGSNRLVDEAVSKWYRSMKEQNIFVNGPLLRQQAVKIARMMNNQTFEANNGWLWRWQQRENVKFNTSGLGRTARKMQSVLDVKNDFYENTSIQSFDDSNRNVPWQNIPNGLEESGVSHSEMSVVVKEEVDDFQRNPFEAEVVFDNESRDEGVCDNEPSRNNYPNECLINGKDDTTKNHQDDESLDHSEPFQTVEMKNQPNFEYRIIDSDEEYERSQFSKTKNSTVENDPKDIYSIYGDYIARRLRAHAKERDNYEIYIAQHNIDDVIFNLSMGSYAREVSQVRPYENNSTNGIVDNNNRQKLTNNSWSYQEKRQTCPKNSSAKSQSNGFQDDRVRLRTTSSLTNTSSSVINCASLNEET
ncbi:uncharacterized protein LOC129942686 [Eupeodes corollae]|uniref:uncharacterized protein LOC129942686 n=1 Tax=Eupeodes corollae TaxID=290404 RepID=UPI00248FD9C3|nr:uncharacterized protein LOC129942686 [Eupeodes corollae]